MLTSAAGEYARTQVVAGDLALRAHHGDPLDASFRTEKTAAGVDSPDSPGSASPRQQSSRHGHSQQYQQPHMSTVDWMWTVFTHDGDKKRTWWPRVKHVPGSSRVRTLRRQIHLLCSGNMGSWPGMACFLTVIACIILSLVTMIVGSLPEFRRRAMLNQTGSVEKGLSIVENVVIIVFVVEFLARLLTASALHPSDTDETEKEESALKAEEGLGTPYSGRTLTTGSDGSGVFDAEGLDDPGSDGSASGAEGGASGDASGTIRKTRSQPQVLPPGVGADGRVYCAPRGSPCMDVPDWGMIKRTLAFFFSFMSLIDMASFVPFLIDIFLIEGRLESTAILRVLRIARVLQLFRFTARTEAFMVSGGRSSSSLS